MVPETQGPLELKLTRKCVMLCVDLAGPCFSEQLPSLPQRVRLEARGLIFTGPNITCFCVGLAGQDWHGSVCDYSFCVALNVRITLQVISRELKGCAQEASGRSQMFILIHGKCDSEQRPG